MVISGFPSLVMSLNLAETAYWEHVSSVFLLEGMRVELTIMNRSLPVLELFVVMILWVDPINSPLWTK